jgi:hypothetical protein
MISSKFLPPGRAATCTTFALLRNAWNRLTLMIDG